MNPMLKKANELHQQAVALRERSDQLLREAIQIYEKESTQAVREADDKLINRTQAIDLLWFGTFDTLRSWEQKMRPYGYLQFKDDKILRSEVLRFIDDYQSGLIHRKLNRRKTA